MSRNHRLVMGAAVLAGITISTSCVVEQKSKPSATSDTSAVPLSVAGAETSRVRIGTDSEGTDAFVAWPGGGEPAPGIVVVQEWWGLNAQIRDVGRRLAEQGYVAIVPDLYHGKVADDPERAHELVRGLVDERALADLTAAVRWLRAEPRTASAKIGVIGFCMGGGLSEKLALSNSEISAAVMFYGTPETDPAKLAPLHAPLQGHFGANDEGIPVERVKQLEGALKRLGKTGEFYVYPNAGHAFMHEGRDSYRADAAKLAWDRTLAFLSKYLKS